MCRFVVFLSGLIHLTLPNSTDEAWVVGGKYGMILAGDTAGKSKSLQTFWGLEVMCLLLISAF